MGTIVNSGIVCPNIVVRCGASMHAADATVFLGECDHKDAPHDSYGVIVPGCGVIVPPLNQFNDPWLALTVSKRGEVEIQFGPPGSPGKTGGINDATITVDGVALVVHWDNGRKAYRTRSPELLAAFQAKVGQTIQVGPFEQVVVLPPAGTAKTPVIQTPAVGVRATAHTLPVNPDGSLYVDLS